MDDQGGACTFLVETKGEENETSEQPETKSSDSSSSAETGTGPTKEEDATSTRDMYHSEAQKLIAGINQKRKRDTDIIADYKKAMEMQVQKHCTMIEQNLFQIYEKEGKLLQEKLQELFETLDRIVKVEEELNQFRQALGFLYQDVHH